MSKPDRPAMAAVLARLTTYEPSGVTREAFWRSAEHLFFRCTDGTFEVSPSPGVWMPLNHGALCALCALQDQHVAPPDDHRRAFAYTAPDDEKTLVLETRHTAIFPLIAWVSLGRERILRAERLAREAAEQLFKQRLAPGVMPIDNILWRVGERGGPEESAWSVSWEALVRQDGTVAYMSEDHGRIGPIADLWDMGFGLRVRFDVIEILLPLGLRVLGPVTSPKKDRGIDLVAIDSTAGDIRRLTDHARELERVKRAACAWAPAHGKADSTVLASVKPESIRADLRRLGFTLSRVRDEGDLWTYPAGGIGRSLAVPDEQTDGGYAERVHEATRAVATVENVSPILVLARWLSGELP